MSAGMVALAVAISFVAGFALGAICMAVLAAGGRADDLSAKQLEEYRLRPDWDPDKQYQRS